VDLEVPRSSRGGGTNDFNNLNRVNGRKASCFRSKSPPHRHRLEKASRIFLAVRTSATCDCRLGARRRRVPIRFANDADKLVEPVEVRRRLRVVRLSARCAGWPSQPWRSGRHASRARLPAYGRPRQRPGADGGLGATERAECGVEGSSPELSTRRGAVHVSVKI
jgi:hypothetical protein